jgi:hypothetical protein
VHDSAPFPFLDNVELWLLDRQDQPLALLDSESRRQHERLARKQPVKMVENYRLYPEIGDNAVIEAACVEVRLRETVAKPETEEQLLSTCYVELSPGVTD